MSRYGVRATYLDRENPEARKTTFATRRPALVDVSNGRARGGLTSRGSSTYRSTYGTTTALLKGRVGTTTSRRSLSEREVAPTPRTTEVEATPVCPPPAALADVPFTTATTVSPHMDRKYHDDVMHVPDLVQEIFEKLRETEMKHLCDPAYMERQTEINEKMRSILVDWLVDVHLKFKLFPETFYLTINIVDRYLSQKSIARRKLQLLGITCMLIASKYEEIYPPELRDFIYISARAYTRSEILHMERQVLNVIGYHLTVATPHTFMDRFFEAGALSSKERHLAMFFVDSALQSYKMLKYKPSVLVAGAVYLSRMYSQGAHPWTSDLQHYTQYDREAVLPCARDIHEATLTLQSGKLKAVRQKYAKSGYSEVAAFALAKSSTISAF